MDHIFNPFAEMPAMGLGSPKIDMYQTDNEVVVSCEIPGIDNKDDININIDQNTLTISGTINRSSEVREEQMHRRERYIGRFHRSIPLPARVAAEQAKATYKNGILEIRVPKTDTEQGKKIDIDFH